MNKCGCKIVRQYKNLSFDECEDIARSIGIPSPYEQIKQGIYSPGFWYGCGPFSPKKIDKLIKCSACQNKSNKED